MQTTVRDMEVVFAPVSAAIRTTRTGRRMFASWQGNKTWMTAKNVVTDLPSSGLTVDPAATTGLPAKITAAQQASQAYQSARVAAARARVAYGKARRNVEMAISQLRASMLRARFAVATSASTAVPPKAA